MSTSKVSNVKDNNDVIEEEANQQQQIRIPDNMMLLTKDHVEQLKKSGEVSLFTMLHNLDGYDEVLGNSLNILKISVDQLFFRYGQMFAHTPDDKTPELLKSIVNHTIQVFLHRHNIKMQIASKFNTSVQGTNENQQQQPQQV
jgi:hypothetical protein